MSETAKPCDHSITLEGVVEICAECTVVISRRRSQEASLRTSLARAEKALREIEHLSLTEDTLWDNRSEWLVPKAVTIARKYFADTPEKEVEDRGEGG